MDSRVFSSVFQVIAAIVVSMVEMLPEILRIAVLTATFIHIVIKIKKDSNIMPMGKYGYAPKKKSKPAKKTKATKKKKPIKKK